MSRLTALHKDRLLLDGEDWVTYQRLLRVFDERRHLRITFDRGALEIMTLSPEHERCKHLIGRLIETLTEELGLPIAGYDSMTLKRRRQQRGLEPDECYWIQHADRVRDLQTYDPRRDPPPDLVVEVDISRSSLNRLDIYAALSVPEVWRFNGSAMTICRLQSDSTYSEQPTSLTFDKLRSADLERFLQLRGRTDENEIIPRFRAWIREKLARR